MISGFCYTYFMKQIQKNILKETGAARIGFINSGFPFSSLRVTENNLEIKTTFLGTYTFQKDDIISIEKYSFFLQKGIKINHRIKKYNSNIIFFSFSGAKFLLSEINRIGFFNTKDSHVSSDEQAYLDKKNKFPVKIPALVGIIVIWNLLLIPTVYQAFVDQNLSSAVNMTPLATGFILLLGSMFLLFEPSRSLILKEGSSFNEIKLFIKFIMFIMTFLFIGSLLMPF